MAGLDRARLDACSPVYKSEPQDLRDQPWFMNQAARLLCDRQWTAHGLLHALLDIEQALGRTRLRDKGPRSIDLDLLLFHGQCVQSPELTVPHPRMEQRAFVLIPLLDIAPDLVLPTGKPLTAALARLEYTLSGQCIRQP